MRIRQKRILSAFLAVSSIMGIAIPAVNANATPIEDESKATAEELKAVIKEYSEKLAQKPNFANHHRVNYAAERLEKYDAESAAKAKAFIAQYDSQVFTKEIVEIITKMDTFSGTKNMQTFDELLNVDIPALAKIDEESAEYLKGRLDVWGQAVVFDADPNYAKATNEIIKVQKLREEGKLEEAATQVDAAKEAIVKIATLELNGPYLEAKLKSQEDLVNQEIEKQDLYVRGVIVANAREIYIVFNRPIDEDIAGDIKKFEITPANSDAKPIVIEDIATGAKVVRLDISGLNNKKDAKYLVKVKDVANTDGKEMKDYSEIINLHDNKTPTVKSVEYNNGDKQIEINFSEPIANNGDCSKAIKLKLDGANVNLKEAWFEPDVTSCIIHLDEINLDKDKIYNIEINGLTDYAGNALEKYTGDILVAEDNEKPNVKKIKVLSRNVFDVSFTEGIKDNDFKVLVDGKDTGFTKTKRKIILDDTPDYKEGNKLITIYDYEDNSGNKGEPITKEVYFEPKHPALDSPDAEIKNFGKNRFAKFTFDRDLKERNDFKVEVKHENKDGVTVTDEVPVVFDGTDIYVLITNLENGDYRFDLEPSDITDKYAQKIEKTTLTFTNNTTEKTCRVSKVEPNDQKKDSDKVIVKFDKEVGDDALTPSNYTINNEPVFESAIFKENKKTVELTLKEGAIVTTGDKTFKVEGLKNVKDYIEVHTFQENVKPEIDKAEVISFNKIKLTMSETINSDYTIDKNDLKVRVNNQSLSGDMVLTGQGTDTMVITLTTQDTLSSDDKVTIEILEDNTIADSYGNAMKAQFVDVVFNPDSLFDTASEEVDKLKAECDKLEKYIDEKVTNPTEIFKPVEDQLVKANNAVKELNENSIDRNKMQDKIKTEENRINVFKAEVAINDLRVACDKLTDENIANATEVLKDAEAKLKIVDDKITDLKKASVDTTNLEKDRKVQSDRIDEFEVKVAKFELNADKLKVEIVEGKIQIAKIKDDNNKVAFNFTVSPNAIVAKLDDKGDIEITRPIDKDYAEVEITVTISKGDKKETKKFTLTVPKGEGEITLVEIK